MDSTILGLGVAGIAGGLLSRINSPVKEWVKRKTTTAITVEGSAFDAVMAKLVGSFDDTQYAYSCVEGSECAPGSGESDIPKRLAPGVRLATVEGRKVVVDVSREKMFNHFLERASLTARMKDREWLMMFVEGAIREARNRLPDGLYVYVANVGGYFSRATVRPFRPVASIEHPLGIPDAMVRNVREWESTEQDCIRRGENFHLGFLLYGPPGTGKTSMAIALASELRRPLYVLTPKVAQKCNIEELVSNLPSNAVFLVEECEQVFPKRRGAKGEDAQVAAALSCFDGPLSKHGLVRVYTTNFPEQLDPSFRREGRCDFEYEFPERHKNGMKGLVEA